MYIHVCVCTCVCGGGIECPTKKEIWRRNQNLEYSFILYNVSIIYELQIIIWGKIRKVGKRKFIFFLKKRSSFENMLYSVSNAVMFSKKLYLIISVFIAKNGTHIWSMFKTESRITFEKILSIMMFSFVKYHFQQS